MSSFDYLKTAIKQQGCTLQQVADASGMTKGYLSQLLNAKIKSPSAQKLEALHRFLGLEFPRQKKTIGVVFGKFYPLHTGHIYLIQRACSQVDELHIIMGFDDTRDRALFEDSAMSQQPTVPDRLRWLLQTFKYQKNIRIHAFNEEGMEPYPHGWDVWSNGIKKFMAEKGIQPDLIYTSEEADAPQYMEHLGIETVLVDPKRTFMSISGAQIRENPFRYWEYIPTEVKPFFVRTVAILGGESSGKSTLVNKLANIFNTTSAWEYGRDYVFSHLGGDEIALQYSDYDKIALGHAQYIDFAVKYATTAETLMIIVPDNDILEVTASVLNKDIGFIQPGQEVVIKVDAYPYTRHGYLTGKVKNITADSVSVPDTGLVFNVIISVDRNDIQGERKKIPVTAGMTVMAEIKTGVRSVISYLLSPLKETINES
ncbi:transcriptional regulator, partial [Escherichia coli O157:H7 str. K4396]